jgi:hypothetical protein
VIKCSNIKKYKQPQIKLEKRIMDYFQDNLIEKRSIWSQELKLYKTISYPGLNPFFQHWKTGYYDEVESIKETISPEVLNDISTWKKEQIETK